MSTHETPPNAPTATPPPKKDSRKDKKGGRGGGGGGGGKPRHEDPKTGRQITVSKAMSFILRHAAEKEGLKMDAQGYASVGDLLAWRKLKSLKVTFPEIVDAVASSDKKRFGLLYLPPSASTSTATSTAESTPTTAVESTSTAEQAGDTTSPQTTTNDTTETATATALAAATTDQDPTHYLIRATQGHSIKTVEAAGLLERLTPTTSNLPSTVVHGTFHGAWPLILESGGLRCMGRNQVHFATGPEREAVLARSQHEQKEEGAVGGGGGGHGQVISGMRRDAQVLIYIDLVKALQLGCPFWRSENGVILSEGIEGMVPLEVVDAVVERRLGTIWERGAVVQQWPAEWSRRRNPKGKGKGQQQAEGRGEESDGR
ncbi:tRNA 2'-phosphotransferase [Aspergillus brunneoviolaceus CBS 621.78]|uniref:Uncharacterized protein n=1 Tax=Aspergillus brunneoviolaceus CBS 621.78 TaxID=1450534 RepID=A0ACD1FWX3_9EURO|nr:hypothetical protein BO95DRAFT_373163 [Aspergillus brunneoviolaceus CBS 621.78]RAH41445.1 hypothetical protein BO95DRAFT_373163 [Aspergillus brunneoviolaceus CBS 621.78]